jgi:hypothetical protein
MRKIGPWLAIAFTALVIAGCKKEPSKIEGAWAIDMEPMLRQARSLGASNREVENVRETFCDGKLTVDGSRITLTIAGIQGSEVFDYKVASKDGDCLNLIINSATHKYCVSGERLEVHDPSTKLVAIYRKV